MKTTPIPVKFDRQGHSCNFYAGFGPTQVNCGRGCRPIAVGIWVAHISSPSFVDPTILPMATLLTSLMCVGVYAWLPEFPESMHPCGGFHDHARAAFGLAACVNLVVDSGKHSPCPQEMRVIRRSVVSPRCSRLTPLCPRVSARPQPADALALFECKFLIIILVEVEVEVGLTLLESALHSQ